MNENQFKEQVLPLSRRLFGLCLKIVGNHDEAKDIVQDVFVRLWTTRESLNTIKNIQAYATTISRNLSLDRLRLRKPTIDFELAAYKIDAMNDEADFDFNNDRIKLITSVLCQLTEIQQQVFTMRDIECLEFAEIATETGLSEENVRVTLSRTRKRIRELIENKTRQQIIRN